jgi:hypothetical protein
MEKVKGSRRAMATEAENPGRTPAAMPKMRPMVVAIPMMSASSTI